jgi:hypothetical protein
MFKQEADVTPIQTPRTTLVGIFEDRLAAERAVDELERNNFKSDQVGYAIRGTGDPAQRGMISDAEGTKDARGAIAGTAVGGIFGALTGLGISEDEARQLEHEFKSGRAIVAVKAGPRAAEAAEIMRRHGGYDIQNRRQTPVQTEGAFSQP